MNLAAKYEKDVDKPSEATLHSLMAYAFEDICQRAYVATKGLTSEDLSFTPENGAMSIGEQLRHQLALVRMAIENLAPGEGKAVPRPDIGEPGHWNLDAMLEYREALNDKFRDVWSRTTPETLMETRPDQKPDHWADWPVLMRFCRPIIDVAHHTGQIAYARRLMGKPVGK